MTDFLVDPIVGRTSLKIDSSVKDTNVLWPSTKMANINQMVLFGTGGTLAANRWTLLKGAVAQTLVADSNGYYQLMVKHQFISAVGQPVPFSYAINGGTQVPMGWVYYSNVQDVGTFLHLKKGDVVTVHEPSIHHSLNMVSYSKMYFWMFRKLMDAPAPVTVPNEFEITAN
jgi:hypothetical protein